MWYAYVLLPIALMMGMAHQLRWPSHGIVVARIALLLSSILSYAILVLVTIDYQRVAVGFKAMYAQRAGQTFERQLLIPPPLTFFSDYYAYFNLSRLSPREGMSAQEISFIENMSHRFGYLHVLNKLAEVYAPNGDPRNAQQTMLTLQKLHPFTHPEYFDFWKKQAAVDVRYSVVFGAMPMREAN